MTLRCGPVTVERLGPTTVRLAARTGVVAYLDPAGDLPDSPDGDLVLVTERVDPAAIDRIAREDALVVVVPEGIDATGLALPVERVAPDESFVVGPLDLHTTSAAGADGERGAGCGYAVTIDGVTAFWPGRTAVLDSHRNMSVDLLFAPVGLEGAMALGRAVDLAEALDPDLVVPIGSESAVDVESFVVDVATRGVPIALEPPARG